MCCSCLQDEHLGVDNLGVDDTRKTESCSNNMESEEGNFKEIPIEHTQDDLGVGSEYQETFHLELPFETNEDSSEFEEMNNRKINQATMADQDDSDEDFHLSLLFECLAPFGKLGNI